MEFAMSENTSDFDINDIAVVNGTLSNFATVSNDSYEVDFTPTANGNCSVRVGAAMFTDAAGNDNTASNVFTFTYSELK